MTTMYYADFRWATVVPVEVQRVTDAQVVLATGQREAKITQYGAYYETADGAFQGLRAHLAADVEDARRALTYLEYRLAALEAQQAVQP